MASAQLDLYKIHVLNFNKHNSSLKSGHKKTLISNNFCTDSKLGVLPLTVRWMFLGIVLTCGDFTSDTIEMNEKQLRDLLESSWSVPRALTALQQIQVLTWSKIDLFIIENNIKENKVIEDNIIAEPPAPSPVIPKKTKSKKVHQESDFFKQAFELYKTEINIHSKGKSAAKNFDEQIKDQTSFEEILKSIRNYRIYLSIDTWRSPKQSFATYLGTESSEFFWRQWIDWKAPVKTQAKPSQSQAVFDQAAAQIQAIREGKL